MSSITLSTHLSPSQAPLVSPFFSLPTRKGAAAESRGGAHPLDEARGGARTGGGARRGGVRARADLAAELALARLTGRRSSCQRGSRTGRAHGGAPRAGGPRGGRARGGESHGEGARTGTGVVGLQQWSRGGGATSELARQRRGIRRKNESVPT